VQLSMHGKMTHCAGEAERPGEVAAGRQRWKTATNPVEDQRIQDRVHVEDGIRFPGVEPGPSVGSAGGTGAVAVLHRPVEGNVGQRAVEGPGSGQAAVQPGGGCRQSHGPHVEVGAAQLCLAEGEAGSLVDQDMAGQRDGVLRAPLDPAVHVAPVEIEVEVGEIAAAGDRAAQPPLEGKRRHVEPGRREIEAVEVEAHFPESQPAVLVHQHGDAATDRALRAADLQFRHRVGGAPVGFGAGLEPGPPLHRGEAGGDPAQVHQVHGRRDECEIEQRYMAGPGHRAAAPHPRARQGPANHGEIQAVPLGPAPGHEIGDGDCGITDDRGEGVELKGERLVVRRGDPDPEKVDREGLELNQAMQPVRRVLDDSAGQRPVPGQGTGGSCGDGGRIGRWRPGQRHLE